MNNHKKIYILGISAYYHDSAACLLCDGDIIAASQEERFSRKKHDSNFPIHAVKYCLEEAKIKLENINKIIFYEKPFVKFERLIETYLAFAPLGFKSFIKAMPLWIRDKLFQKSKIIKELTKIGGKKLDLEKKILFSEHHLSHAASAFYPSPFKKSAILTFDGVGEWTTTSVSIGNGKNIKIIKEIHFPHSIGLLYSAFTYYTGFKVNSGEYKVMGLAPYGKPKYYQLIKDNLISIAEDGSFKLNLKYFNYATGLTMTNKRFHNLFGGLPRQPESRITQRDMDLAASIQKIVEEIVIKISKNIAEETGEKNLCLAGGVALNCVINGILLRENIFENIWVQPAAGDAGGSLGAAFVAWHLFFEKERVNNFNIDGMKGCYIGPEYSNEQIEKELSKLGANYKKFSLDQLLDVVAKEISNEKIVGWMQGRMEFGPRSLGNRSILADPRSSSMQKKLNIKVKQRESFRPFAPSIIDQHLSLWFNHSTPSPYMMFVAKVNDEKCISMTEEQNALFGIDKLNVKRSSIPAVTHIDYSARIQTVHKETNPRYYSLINKFYELTKCPILINTSFNVRGEPIVCNATDAFKCFMNTDIDILVVGNFFLKKENQNFLNYEPHEKYKLD